MSGWGFLVTGEKINRQLVKLDEKKRLFEFQDIESRFQYKNITEAMASIEANFEEHGKAIIENPNNKSDYVISLESKIFNQLKNAQKLVQPYTDTWYTTKNTELELANLSYETQLLIQSTSIVRGGCIVGFLLGIALAYIGVYFWYFRVQVHQDKKAENNVY